MQGSEGSKALRRDEVGDLGPRCESPGAPQKIDGPLVEGRGAVRYQPGPGARLLAHASANRCSSWLLSRHSWRLRCAARLLPAVGRRHPTQKHQKSTAPEEHGGAGTHKHKQSHAPANYGVRSA